MSDVSWIVNPNDGLAYATINAAVADASVAGRLVAGAPIIVGIAPGMNHALAGGALVLPATRDVIIRVLGKSIETDFDADTTTRVTGNITLSDASAEAKRRLFVLEGANLVGNLVMEAFWCAQLRHAGIQGVVTRNHLGAGAGEGCWLELDDVINRGTAMKVTDTDITSTPTLARIRIRNSHILIHPAGTQQFQAAGTGRLEIDCENTVFEVDPAATGVVFDFNTPPGGGALLRLKNVHFSCLNNASVTMLANHANLTVSWENTTVKYNTNGGIAFAGATGTHIGAPRVIGFTGALAPVPATPPVGTSWQDNRTGDQLVWDGTYWDCGGGRKRHEVVMAVGVGAVASVDIGWNAPADAYIVKAALRLLKAITPDGPAACKQVGLGVAADPNKYGSTTTLLANAVGGLVNPTYANGAAEDFVVYACDAAGAAAGTIAGSIADDIRIIVWFEQPTVPTA
jgi:hypothetical protein